jgi:hypothetical protein
MTSVTHLIVVLALLCIPHFALPEQATTSGGLTAHHRIVLASGTSSNSQLRELRGALLDRDARPMSGDSTLRESGFLLKLPATAPPILLNVDTAVWMIQ